MTTDSFHRTLDAALEATRDAAPAVCTVCKVGHVDGAPNADGRTSVRCGTCGSRYWLN